MSGVWSALVCWWSCPKLSALCIPQMLLPSRVLQHPHISFLFVFLKPRHDHAKPSLSPPGTPLGRGWIPQPNCWHLDPVVSVPHQLLPPLTSSPPSCSGCCCPAPRCFSLLLGLCSGLSSFGNTCPFPQLSVKVLPALGLKSPSFRGCLGPVHGPGQQLSLSFPSS